MGRPLRIFIPGYAYHVIVRGNERKNIFKDEVDFRYFLKVTGIARDKYEFMILAYVLMNNHYHLLVELKKPNLSKAIQYINTCYCIYGLHPRGWTLVLE